MIEVSEMSHVTLVCSSWAWDDLANEKYGKIALVTAAATTALSGWPGASMNGKKYAEWTLSSVSAITCGGVWVSVRI